MQLFLSTHFHIIIRGNNADRFIEYLSRCITRGYNSKYHKQIKMNISKRQLENPFSIMTAINYVLKNPIHHKLCLVPLNYPYSSIGCYFKNELSRKKYCEEENKTPYKRPSELINVSYRELFVKHKAPEHFLIAGDRMVIPETFVNSRYVELLYDNSKKFLYNMTKPLQEEIEMFGEDRNAINAHLNKIALCGRLTDTEVCKLIDGFSAPHSFTELSEKELSELWLKLQKLGVDKYQFERCT